MAIAVINSSKFYLTDALYCRIEPPIGKPRDSLFTDSYLDIEMSPTQRLEPHVRLQGLFNHGRTDRDVYLTSLLIFFQVLVLYNEQELACVKVYEFLINRAECTVQRTAGF